MVNMIKNTRKQLPLHGILAPIEILTLLAHLLPFAKKKHFNSSLLGLFHEPESPPLTLRIVCTFPG